MKIHSSQFLSKDKENKTMVVNFDNDIRKGKRMRF